MCCPHEQVSDVCCGWVGSGVLFAASPHGLLAWAPGQSGLTLLAPLLAFAPVTAVAPLHRAQARARARKESGYAGGECAAPEPPWASAQVGLTTRRGGVLLWSVAHGLEVVLPEATPTPETAPLSEQAGVRCGAEGTAPTGCACLGVGVVVGRGPWVAAWGRSELCLFRRMASASLAQSTPLPQPAHEAHCNFELSARFAVAGVVAATIKRGRMAVVTANGWCQEFELPALRNP